MRTPDQTLEEILTLAATHFKVAREKLTPDDDFFKTLGIDSLQVDTYCTTWRILKPYSDRIVVRVISELKQAIWHMDQDAWAELNSSRRSQG